LALSAVVAPPAEMVEMLLRGEIDAAVVAHAPSPHPDLRAIEIATWTRGVYARTPTRGSAEYRSVVVGTPSETPDDGWPLDRERIVRAWAPDERAALELCARGDLITIAYDAVVRASGFAQRLFKIATPEIPSRTLYVLHRRAVGRHRRTEALVDAIRTAAQHE